MKNKYIPIVLKEYRKKNQLTVDEVSQLLLERSIQAAPKTIYGWESGQASPRAEILLALCEIYNITDVLTAFQPTDDTESFHVTTSERALIKAYRKHQEMQRAVNKLLDLKVVPKKKPTDTPKQDCNKG